MGDRENLEQAMNKRERQILGTLERIYSGVKYLVY